MLCGAHNGRQRIYLFQTFLICMMPCQLVLHTSMEHQSVVMLGKRREMCSVVAMQAIRVLLGESELANEEGSGGQGGGRGGGGEGGGAVVQDRWVGKDIRQVA